MDLYNLKQVEGTHARKALMNLKRQHLQRAQEKTTGATLGRWNCNEECNHHPQKKINTIFLKKLD